MNPADTNTPPQPTMPGARALSKRRTKNAATPEAPAQDAPPANPARAPRKRPAAKAKLAPVPAKSAPPKPVARKAEKAEKIEKADKPKKPKMVRDSLTMPKTEYAVIDAMKLRAAKAGHPAKKTEVIRAALKVLAALSDDAFLTAMQAVPSIKTGRPAKTD